ncbi:MAG: DUF861 domain-containing protein [Pseudonocardiaceae bacterium]|nr:DUF861 domain-containing protein [Pseudonocardiaceae bacterium]
MTNVVGAGKDIREPLPHLIGNGAAMAGKAIRKGNTEAKAYVPYQTPNGSEGEVCWIRENGTDGVDVRVGIWRCGDGDFPNPFPVTFAGAESLYVLEGTLQMELADTGEKVTANVGDIVSVERGTRTVWTVPSRLKAIMFIAGGES